MLCSLLVELRPPLEAFRQVPFDLFGPLTISLYLFAASLVVIRTTHTRGKLLLLALERFDLGGELFELTGFFVAQLDA